MSSIHSEKSRPARALLSIAKRHMATDFVLEVVVDPAQARIGESVLTECHALLDAIEDSLSEYRERTPIYRLNRAPAGEWVDCDAAVVEALDLSREFSERAPGTFTPFARSPYAATFADLELDREGGRVRRNNEAILVGFGAVGKGYALDRVAAVLDRQGFADYRLGAGGSSWVFRGFDANDAAWEVGWAWAKDADGDWVGQRYRLPGGKPIAIGVSGTVEKGEHFLWQGAPLRVNIQSAFCAANSAAEADALSTAVMVGATREGEGFLTKLPGSGIHPLALAYVDLENQMIYNQVFDTQFLREGRIT